MSSDNEVTAEQFLRMLVLMRSNGASIRAMAKCLNMSKSRMGRWVQMIDGIELSQLGQPGENSPDISTPADVDLSQMGQAPPKRGAP